MNRELEIATKYLAQLSAQKRQLVLAVLSHDITVGIRALAHDAASMPNVVESIRQLNEAHHRVAGYLMHMASGTEDTAALESVAAYIVLCEDAYAKVQIAQSWERAQRVSATAG